MNICEAALLAFNQGQCICRKSTPDFVIDIDELVPEDATRFQKRYCFSNRSLVWKATADDIFADDWETTDVLPSQSVLEPEPAKESCATGEYAMWNRSYWIPAALTLINFVMLTISLIRTGWFV